jgi:hypothetical protein
MKWSCLAIGLTGLTLAGCELLTGPDESEVDDATVARAPAGREVFAVDVSYYQGYLEESEVACWWDRGVRHFISGIQNSDITVQQLQTALSVGMSIDAYVPLYWDQDITRQVEFALSVIEPFPVQRLWLDAERLPGGLTSTELIGKIREAVDACGDFPCGIYTRKTWWLAHVADTEEFSRLPIWYAYYNGQNNFDDWYDPQAWYEGPFGGWVDPTGKQYDSSDTGPLLCGVEVDYNTMFGLNPPTNFQAEIGKVTVEQADADAGHSVSLRNTYASPVVIIQPPSYYDSNPTTIRILNVSPNSFQFQIDEWDYQDGAHGTETVSYLVAESGVHRLADGGLLEAGNASIGHQFRAVELRQSFTSTPVILTQVQTYNDAGAVVTRQRAASAAGFQVKVQEEEGNDGYHAHESVGYIAIESGPGVIGGTPFEASVTPNAVTDTWRQLSFVQRYADPVFVASLQTANEQDPAGLRYRLLRSSGVQVLVEEERSADSEVSHTSETVGYVVLGAAGDDDDDGELPPAPTGLSPANGVTLTAASVTLSCDALSGVSEYEFEIGYESGGTWLYYYSYNANANQQTFWPQYEDTRYRWRVRARNARGWGPWSEWATFNFGDVGAGLPPAPTGLSPSNGVTITSGSVALTCDAISGVSEYQFEIEHESGGTWHYYYTYSSDTNSQTFWPQYNDRRYRWRVRARNSQGWGPWSEWAVFNFGDEGDGDVPPAPTGLDPSDGESISTSSVTLSCDAISGVTEYEFVIEYESGGNWLYYYTYSSNSCSTTFWPQIDDTRYRWKVRARNAQGWGPWSVWATFNFGDTGDGDVPPAPTGLDPSNGQLITTSSVTLSCDAISGVSEYEFVIEYESSGSWYYYYTYASNTCSQTFWPQVSNTRYRWRVRARNAQGWSPWSVWATFRFS